MENVTRGMIRSGWKGYSDSFDPWLGSYPEVYNTYPNVPQDENKKDENEKTFREKYEVFQDGPNKGKPKIPWWYNLGGWL